RPAVRVRDRHPVVPPRKPIQRGAHRRGDPLRPVVHERGQRVDVDLQPAPPGDPPDVGGARSAGDHRDPAHPGNASWSTNRSLKSSRPESSTYSTSCTMDSASARSRWLSAAILAPSLATLPADTMRGSASRGTRPIRIALAGDRYAPNEPASSTWEMSSGP